jgi:hypothetical protein
MKTVSILALSLLSTTAVAQNWRATPTYTTLNLNAGFNPDPTSVSIRAGGADRVTQSGCRGYIHNAAPDVDLNYTSGSLPLVIYTESDADTTLLINTPSGNWLCDDDSGRGTDAAIHMTSPESGNYNIWVGNYNGTDTPAATLHVSELPSQAGIDGYSGGGGGGGGGGNSPNLSASPTYTTWNLSAGFSPDPTQHSIRAGGNDRVTINGCAGYIHNAAPDIRLNYSSGSLPLHIYAMSDADTTLVINKPDGSWICDDDSNNRDPAVSMRNPMSGQYDIWVGNYNGTDTPDATVYVTELDINWSGK